MRIPISIYDTHTAGTHRAYRPPPGAAGGGAGRGAEIGNFTLIAKRARTDVTRRVTKSVSQNETRQHITAVNITVIVRYLVR